MITSCRVFIQSPSASGGEHSHYPSNRSPQSFKHYCSLLECDWYSDKECCEFSVL